MQNLASHDMVFILQTYQITFNTWYKITNAPAILRKDYIDILPKSKHLLQYFGRRKQVMEFYSFAITKYVGMFNGMRLWKDNCFANNRKLLVRSHKWQMLVIDMA